MNLQGTVIAAKTIEIISVDAGCVWAAVDGVTKMATWQAIDAACSIDDADFRPARDWFRALRATAEQWVRSR